MNLIERLELEIVKERACVDDIITVINIHMQHGRFDLAAERGRDMLKSIQRIHTLHITLKFHKNISKVV